MDGMVLNPNCRCRWFWEVVSELDKEDLALLLQFLTGTSKVGCPPCVCTVLCKAASAPC